MSYRRRSYYNENWKQNTKTIVSVHWSNLYPAYDITFSNTYHWDEMQVLISWIKKIPYGERDCSVSIGSNGKNIWTWNFIEKYVEPFNMMVSMMENFELDFIKKPEAQNDLYAPRFIPTEVLLDKFKEITGVNISTFDYSGSKKVYRGACLRLHPDRNPDDPNSSDKMSKLNEVWTNLEVQHFKVKQLALALEG
jgi:hypothetical protein